MDEHNRNCDWKGATNVEFKERKELDGQLQHMK